MTQRLRRGYNVLRSHVARQVAVTHPTVYPGIQGNIGKMTSKNTYMRFASAKHKSVFNEFIKVCNDNVGKHMSYVNSHEVDALMKDYAIRANKVFIKMLTRSLLISRAITTYLVHVLTEAKNSEWGASLYSNSLACKLKGEDPLKHLIHMHNQFNMHVVTMSNEQNHNDVYITSLYDYIESCVEFISDCQNTLVFRNTTTPEGRAIVVVNRRLSSETRNIVKEGFGTISTILDGFMSNLPHKITSVSHGFSLKKSIQTNAAAHVNAKSMINVDITKFFPSSKLSTVYKTGKTMNLWNMMFSSNGHTTPYTFYDSDRCNYHDKTYDHEPIIFTNENGKLAELPLGSDYLEPRSRFCNLWFLICHMIMHNGVLPTGCSYAPAWTNIWFAPIDAEILHAIHLYSRGRFKIVYTRYADDLTFSCDVARIGTEHTLNMGVVKIIEKVLNNNLYYLNYDKTKICGPGDKKVVTGIVIHGVKHGNLGYSELMRSRNVCLSIGSNAKREFAASIAGKRIDQLTPSEIGKLSHIRNVNPKQFQYCIGKLAVTLDLNVKKDGLFATLPNLRTSTSINTEAATATATANPTERIGHRTAAANEIFGQRGFNDVSTRNLFGETTLFVNTAANINNRTANVVHTTF